MKQLMVGAALASVATISLTACGSSSSAPMDPMASHAAASIAQKMLSEQGSSSSLGGLKMDSTQANCIGNGVVSKIGVKQLTTYGLLDAQGNATSNSSTTASAADATTFVNTVFDCIGTDTVAAALKSRIEAGAGTGNPKITTCLDSLLTTDAVKSLMVAALQGKTSTAATAAQKDLTTKLMACAMK